MTGYAVAPDRQFLVRVIPTPRGTTVGDVAPLDGVSEELRLRLAEALTRLSEAFWTTYTEPASAAMDDLSIHSEGVLREEERAALAQIPDTIRHPNLPVNGQLLQSYIRPVEMAHQLGRILRTIDDAILTDTIVAEAEDEIRAVESAEVGDLTGRAAQAVLLTRADASPPQVAAAFDLLWADPFGSARLRESIDPHSAAVAAAYWLACAAEVASELSGTDPAAVVMEADDIQAVPVETPTTVLTWLARDDNPYQAIEGLLRIATAVADGAVPAPLIRTVLETHAGLDPDGLVPLSFIDPKRPAPDLLTDLLSGIEAAFLVWNEYDEDDDLPAEDASNEVWAEHERRRRASFAADVRIAAEANRHRLGLAAS